MTWKEVQKVLNVNSFQQYVACVNLCPAVDENLRLAVDEDYDTIRFAWKTILANKDILEIVKNAQVSYQGLQNLSFNFRSKLDYMTNQLQEIGTKIVFQQESLAKETKKGLQAVNSLTEKGIKTLQETTDEGMKFINSAWLQFSGNEFNSFKAKINDTMKDYDHQISTKKSDFAEWINNKTK
jgi:hypothetical protein